MGWTRTFLIALLVNGSASPLLVWVGNQLGLVTDGSPAPTAASVLVIAVAVAWLVAVQVGVLAVLEALVPTGNILLDPDAEDTNGLSLLDFGSVGRLDRGARTSLAWWWPVKDAAVT